MKNNLLSVMMLAVLFLLPAAGFAQAPNLGTAAGFVLFSADGAVTNTGITHLTGNVGTNVGSSTGFGNVNGVMHDDDTASAACAADLLIAYHQLNIAVPTFFPSPLLGNNDTLVAGVYHISSAATLDSNLVLNAQGNPNAVFIFQIQGSFSTSAGSKVKLINGAVACNVFWKVEGLVSMASATAMKGTIIANNAAITMNPNDTLEGRALSTTGAVTVNGILAYMPIGCGSATLTGPLAPALASTAPFAIFSHNGDVTNSGTTHVIGDVGTNVGVTSGFDSADVTGSIHPIPDDSTAAAAADMLAVYNYLNTLHTDIELLYPAQFGNGLVLTPHTYLMASAPTFTGTVYLDAEGDNNAVFVIKINGALSTGTFSNVMLLNGAQAKNVFWKVDGAVDIDNSTFNGTIVANNAAINLNPGGYYSGRALTTNGAITTNGINISLPVTAACAAPAISGAKQVCAGTTTALTDSTGGKWSSSDTAVAAIDSVSGIARGVTAGTSIITYTSQAGCTSSATVTVSPSPSAINGPGNVCVGSTINLSDDTTGGTWTSGNLSQATVGSGTGTVTGVTQGTPDITYTAPNGCAAEKMIIVGPYAGIIQGPSRVCVASIITLTDTTTGGTWTSSNARAIVVGGVVTGISAGIDTIMYAVTNLCGTDTAMKIVSVDTLQIVDSITGPSSVCVGSSIILTDSTNGGTWSASNAHATVIGGTVSGIPIGGIVTGISAGVDTIRYTITNACGITNATKAVTVNPLPDEGAITGPSTVCTGSSVTLTDFAPGGTWSSSNTTATVLGGVVTGVTAGVDTIRYTVANSCGTATAAKTVTVNAAPDAGVITGPSSVCIGTTTTLTESVSGGIWGSSNAHAAVVGGIVDGITSGVDTISYTVTNITCTSTATKSITVDSASNAGIIAGPSSVCVGSSMTLTDLSPGGGWNSSNANAVVVGGVVDGITAGTDTIRYIVTNTCSTDTASKIITINAAPDAGVITGPSNVCIGTTTTLTESVSGGVWGSSNAHAAVVGGIVDGITSGVDTISYTVTNITCTSTATKSITVDSAANAGIIAGPSSVCAGSSMTLTDLSPGGGWNSSNANAVVVGGVVDGITAGIDTIRYIVNNTCGSDTASKVITINSLPDPGVITGPSNVCIGSSITLTDTAPGGVWSRSNIHATVLSGLVTGVTAGVDTISYTVTNVSCTSTATKAITVDSAAYAGIIAGPSNVCTGSSITLTDFAPGGTWSSSNATATVLGGVITGVTAGVDTIRYIVTNSCGTATTVRTVTVNAAPNAGVITGPSNVCIGSSITLTDTAPGGVWSGSNIHATVLGGLVTGVAAGVDTINYTVANISCTSTATKTITVDSTAYAGIIAGPSSVCTGSSITLTDLAPGGGWNSSNATAVVVGGVVDGVTAGTDTIRYIVTNTCGTDTASKIITINAAPDAGVITGPTNVCIGSSITLTDTAPGGVWNSSNTNATVLGGLVTGVTAGVDTISYTVVNISCTSTATKTVTIDPIPFAGIIAGPSSVCAGSSMTLTDLAPGGGWNSSNANAVVVGGVVDGIMAGIDTIRYIVANSCGSDTASKVITINSLPDPGVITGPSNVCLGSSITLTDATPGGTWSSSNTNAVVLGGVTTGIAAGIDTISYTVSNISCTASATKVITAYTFPDAGMVNGPSNVCVGTIITLTDTTIGGTWTASNGTATVIGGIVSGVFAGIDTIIYTVTNVCGIDTAAEAITVNPQPNAGVINGPSAVCVGSSITLTDAATGGTWSSPDLTVGVNPVTGVVDGMSAGSATITYTVINMCNTAVATKNIDVNPLPDAGNITGDSSVCLGATTVLTDGAIGGTWSVSNTTATVIDGIVTGINAGVDTVMYSITNSCGTATATHKINVDKAPEVPVISTRAPSSVCDGTMYQNFGADSLPPARTIYNWTAVNANVWAQGTLHQYSLVSFIDTGVAYVTLTATIPGVSCVSQSTVTINVGTTMAQTPEVVYFNNHFVCTPANEDSYQWGYDDANTLDSTILPGEINQDYINMSPDAGKYYWVMTSSGSCAQKTYYHIPTAIQNINEAVVSMAMYPNPASNLVNIVITSPDHSTAQITVLNMMGQKVAVADAMDNKASIEVSALPAGSYFVTCYRDGVRIAGATFIKN